MQRSEIHSITTRQSSNLDIPFSRLSKVQNSHVYIGMKMYMLPQNVQMLPLKLYKSRLYDWLVKNPFYDINEFLELPSQAIVL